MTKNHTYETLLRNYCSYDTSLICYVCQPDQREFIVGDQKVFFFFRNSLFINTCVLSCKGVLIIHQRGHVWVHETRLTTPLLIEVSVPNQESERSCMCVLDVMYLCVRGHVCVC